MNALKSSVAAALLGLFVLATAHPALAFYDVNRWVHNKTAHCVWFTIDTHGDVSAWKNVGAAFVPPGETHKFVVEASTDLKVRAEPRAGAACDQTKVADVQITEITYSPSRLGPSETTITGQGKSFSLRWGK